MNAALQSLLAMLLGVLVALTAPLAAAQSTTNRPLSVPPVPIAKSPVDAFRELLAMDPAALRSVLTNRNETARQRLAAKIREYKAMDPNEMQLRLAATELRWYLMQLMRTPASNRVDRLADIRSDMREFIESRLARWDALDEDLREFALQNEQAFSLLLQTGPASEGLRGQLVSALSPELRASLNRALARLDAMNPKERERAFDLFENFFTMTPGEKDRVMRVMSAAEKEQMQKTLDAFSKLTVEQRKRCIVAYEKFASMTPPARALFYRNVQLWEKMSPKEREQWRALVRNAEILPPMPPVKQPTPPPLPFLLQRIQTNRT